MAFLFATTPAWWRRTSWPAGGANGVFYVGGAAPKVNFESGATATNYAVRDYYGTVVSSGTFSGDSCTPTAPVGGWRCGWYRIQFTGPQSDPTYGNSYGATCFTVVQPDSRFPLLPDVQVGQELAIAPRAAMGASMERLEIRTNDPPAVAATLLPAVVTALSATKTYWLNPPAPQVDPVRERRQWVNFPDETVDKINLPRSGGGVWAVAYVKTEAVNGDTTFVQVDPGTSSGVKVTVRSPDASTVVETFDNLASASAAATAINGSSAYLRLFAVGGSGATMAATAVGRTLWNVIANVVSTLYPDVMHFEGPSNESVLSAEVSHRMRLFRGAVKAGHASAKAIGPCPVNIIDFDNWRAFLDDGGGQWCDEISVHCYNTMEMGTLTARATIQAFLNLLAEYGLSGKKIWDTESNNVLVCQGGVLHPRYAANSLLYALTWEQFGTPRERCPFWYTSSHGFWNFPAWLMNGDYSLLPQCAMYRTLAAETFGMTHSAAMSFGPMGDRIWLGSTYRAPGGAGCAVLQANSPMPVSTITLTVVGTSGTLTVVDAFGNTSTVTPVGGRVTVTVPDAPVYIRLPAGVSVTPYSCNDWAPIANSGQGQIGRAPRVCSMAGEQVSADMSNGSWMANYRTSLVSTGKDFVQSPVLFAGNETAQLTFRDRETLDRLVIFALRPPVYNGVSVPTAFEVDTSADGTTWVTRASYVNSTTGLTDQHQTATIGTNCQAETWFDQQWIFDVPLGGVFTVKAIRIRITDLSHVTEPDAVTATKQIGPTTRRVSLMEVATMCNANAYPQLVRS